MTLVETIRTIKEAEERALKDYKELLKELKRPEDAELRRVILRLAVDKIFHKELMEAIERAYKEASALLKEHIEPFYPELEPIRESVMELDQGLALLPGVPSLLLPLDFGKVGYRIPPEEVLEELIKSFPEISIIPQDKLDRIIEKLNDVVEMEKEMQNGYKELENRAKHPVIRELSKAVLHNEEQHNAILSKIIDKFKK
ncbi:rubrerythrin family protein [Pyrococcus kukulkanii]|uniref:rubrerythrin family protein n=1 Tax=Pyrococcus kukulkanii TaxID=1609559 RepID=UPI00356315A1